MTKREEKPSRNEDEYFVKMDAELLKARRAKLDADRLKQERSIHFMKCPKCGADLAEREMHNIKVDQCTECDGIWLDKGEMELLVHSEEGSGVGRVIRDLLGVRFR